MKREELEKYIGELSHEMLAENDVELSDDALQAVAG